MRKLYQFFDLSKYSLYKDTRNLNIYEYLDSHIREGKEVDGKGSRREVEDEIDSDVEIEELLKESDVYNSERE